MSDLATLKSAGEAPEFLLEEGFRTLRGGYLLPDETPRMMYRRVADAAAYWSSDPEMWSQRYFDVMWKGWLCPATPVLTNMGTNRGMPISCNGMSVPDSVDGIFMKAHELAMLSKMGAGVSVYLGGVRGRGANIKGNGVSEGIVPWAKIYDVTTMAVNQGQTRRGASALYLPIRHLDIEEFLNIRRPTGDVNRRCLNINHAISIDDEWMREMLAGDEPKRLLWKAILKERIETGEPYLFFSDHVNNNTPSCYKDRDMKVVSSNLCSEIALYSDDLHTFVCCLSSLSLAKYDEWKGTDLPAVAIRFLDGVMEEYIQKSDGVVGLEASQRAAIKGRALGLGVLGWHTLLQSKSLPFDSFESMRLNAEVFRTIRAGAEVATKELAEELGEPEWCEGYGRRNTHLLAIAPTVSNSAIAGGYSAGIEPLAANEIAIKGAKGTFIRRNKLLENILEERGANTPEVWKSIGEQKGSVQHLTQLTNHEKEVFLTARELNQHAIIKQAIQRQQWVDQAQSVNLFFASNSDPKYIHQVHVAAWEGGLKTLYYCRAEGVIRADLASRSQDECKACEG
jgi:ribonucleoside-diphosphate reductase alpha chain